MVRQSRAHEQALADIKARRRAAGQKVSRLRHQGVNTDDIDPRLGNSTLEGMSTRQLQSHLRRLNSFTSRNTSYVAGYKGTPLSGSTWRQYQRAERAYNQKSNAFYDSVKDLTIPTLNQTVSQYLNGRTSSTRDGDYRSFGSLNRTATGITSEKSLQHLLVQMQRRADPQYMQREAVLQRRILRKMLERTSSKELIPTIRSMSDEEIITLTQYTDFMDKLKSSYAMAKSISSDTPRWQSSVYEDNEDAIDTLAEWAHRHFSDRQDSAEINDTRTASPARDKYGRFVGKHTLPEPQFVRDEHGRFAPRS